MPPKRSKRVLKDASATLPDVVDAWQFVNISDPNQSKDINSRKLVRANAMRDYRRREKSTFISAYRKTPYGQPGVRDALDQSSTTHNLEQGTNCNSISSCSTDIGQILSRIHLYSSLQLLPGDSEAHVELRGEAPYSAEYYNEIDARDHVSFQTCVVGSPRTPLGPGMSDPFGVYPVSGWSNYDGYVLNHCEQCLPVISFPVTSSI